jgi:putative transcriptional regulator
MTMDEIEGLKGQFLLAMPSLKDPNFSHTVTCLCEHTAQGAFGLVVNRLFPSLNLGNIFEELNIECKPEIGRQPVHIGGPVRMSEIFVLHSSPLDWDGSLMVAPQLAITNTKDIIMALARDKGPSDFILALGCAGWGPGQLESELMDNAWLTDPVQSEIIFDIPINERWATAVKNLGIDPLAISQTAGHG